MAEIQLLRVLGPARDVVLADDAEQPGCALVRVDCLGRRTVDLAAPVAVARREDEQDGAVAPELAAADARPVDELRAELGRRQCRRRRLGVFDAGRDRAGEVGGAARDLLVPAAPGEDEKGQEQ